MARDQVRTRLQALRLGYLAGNGVDMTAVGVVAHEGKSFDGGLDELRHALADAGHADASLLEVPKSKKAPKKVRQLIEDGVDRLLVWGGDGTVRRCIDTIVAEGAHVEIGILPAGTANLLARALEIPTTVREAVDVALHGEPRPIDVGVINGEAFAVMAGTGFDALMIRDAGDGAKRRLGRLSYVLAGARHLATTGADMEVCVDGRVWFEGRAACVLVGNVGRILGGIDVFPDARYDDGVLDIGVVTAQSRAEWLRVGARAVVGGIGSSPLVKIGRARTATVRLDRKLPWELDGGDQPGKKKFDISVLPQRQPICIPGR